MPSTPCQENPDLLKKTNIVGRKWFIREMEATAAYRSSRGAGGSRDAVKTGRTLKTNSETVMRRLTPTRSSTACAWLCSNWLDLLSRLRCPGIQLDLFGPKNERNRSTLNWRRFSGSLPGALAGSINPTVTVRNHRSFLTSSPMRPGGPAAPSAPASPFLVQDKSKKASAN